MKRRCDESSGSACFARGCRDVADTPSSPPIVLITRKQLYRLVWTTPVSHLAPQYGISDVALAKLCWRRSIPRPSRGYWARLAAGQMLLQPELPPVPEGQDRPVVVRLLSRMAPVVIPAAGERLHPIAEKMRRRLLVYKRDHRGLICLEAAGLPFVAVSPALVEKATAASHVLLSHAERCQWVIDTGAHGRGLEIRRGHRSLQFRIEEELAPTSQSAGGTKRKPTGCLRLLTNRKGPATTHGRSWADRGKVPFDQFLTRFIEDVFLPPHAVHHLDSDAGNLQQRVV